MPTLDERVAYLEGRTEDHTGAVSEIRNDVRDLRSEVRDLRGEINKLRDEMNRRFEAMEQKIDRNFTWGIGIQLASVVAIVAALLGR